MQHQELIGDQLKAGEQLLWSGQPRQGFQATFDEKAGSFLVIVGFLLLWMLMVVRWSIRHLSDNGQLNPGTLIVGGGFLVVGWGLLIWVVAGDAWQRKDAHYALTDQRVILVTGVMHRTIRSYPLHQFLRIEVRGRQRHDWLRGLFTHLRV